MVDIDLWVEPSDGEYDYLLGFNIIKESHYQNYVEIGLDADDFNEYVGVLNDAVDDFEGNSDGSE